jgi:prolyl oligopeptidase
MLGNTGKYGLKIFSRAFLIITVISNTASAFEVPFDPFFWLEEVEGDRALQWVKNQNARTVKELESHPIYKQVHKDVTGLLLAKDKVPFSRFHKGYFWNFWQDETYKHGVLRRTTLDEYRKDQPTWEIFLDLDELSRKENENWVYKGEQRMDRNSLRSLVQLSRGGKDAVVVREFDYGTKQFVTDGFYVPEAKTRITPLDENTVLIGTDFGEGSLTESGYARLFKLWRRGQPISEAKTVFEVKKSDLSASALKIRDGKTKTHLIFVRSIDFFNMEVFIQQEDQSFHKLPLPTSAEFLGIKNGYVYALIKNPVVLESRLIPLNSIVRFKLEEKTLDYAQVIFSANNRQSIEDVEIRKDQVFVNILNNVRAQILNIKLNESGEWKSTVLPFPSTGIINMKLKDFDDPTDITTMTYTDPLTPTSQYIVHDEDGSYRLELLKSSPARFDASELEVIQNFATSRDGTQVPYFVLKKKDLIPDASHPTILYGYGGFELSQIPYYSGIRGKVWLERGGVYVISNIRGGGEFGPEWHQAALKENRQRAYDDFIAVAEDLIARKITSPGHLGIVGGSNGGLLVGAAMVQRPELFNAALSQVPLLDMVRFSKLLAGASWMAEYGNPDVPKECANLLTYSPYHNVSPHKRYPRPFFTTSTKDDRVHPAHARKMAARMCEQGHCILFYENINGGHAGSSNQDELAQMTALEYTYLWSQLK